MKLSEVKDLLKAEIVVGHSEMDANVETAFGVDLMSDALAYAKPGCLLITGLITPQTIRTAYALDIAAIVVCRGKVVNEDSLQVARELGMPVLRTRLIMFESCGRLYKSGLVGCITEVEDHAAKQD